jgi:ketosteroid isomerase-like protein
VALAAKDKEKEQALQNQRSQQLDEAAVTRTIRDYEAAFARLDADGVARVQQMTGQQVAELRKSMAGARGYAVTAQIRSIQFSADRRQAVVTAGVNRTYVPTSGRPQTTALTETFVMERRGDSWVIVSRR